jgi:hypothetical protein
MVRVVFTLPLLSRTLLARARASSRASPHDGKNERSRFITSALRADGAAHLTSAASMNKRDGGERIKRRKW